MDDRRTPLARARGLGSAKDGVHHWWVQRLTAIALIPLVVWFAVSLVMLSGADYPVVRAWIGSPLVMVMLILTIGIGLHHAQLGMQVVWEDYTDGALRVVMIVFTKFLAALFWPRRHRGDPAYRSRRLTWPTVTARATARRRAR
jgi:succinate dehydrogenase / fumarate reductase membrane anchor subunit